MSTFQSNRSYSCPQRRFLLMLLLQHQKLRNPSKLESLRIEQNHRRSRYLLGCDPSGVETRPSLVMPKLILPIHLVRKASQRKNVFHNTRGACAEVGTQTSPQMLLLMLAHIFRCLRLNATRELTQSVRNH